MAKTIEQIPNPEAKQLRTSARNLDIIKLPTTQNIKLEKSLDRCQAIPILVPGEPPIDRGWKIQENTNEQQKLTYY